MMLDTALAPSEYELETKPDAPSFSYNDFRSQVGGGWENVCPPVKERMDKLLTSNTPVVFEGEGCVRRSKAGWVFAHLAKALGAPLVWKQGENVKTRVIVAPTKNGLRCWRRLFIFPDGYEQLVQTSKAVDPKLGFIDAVGAEGEKLLATKMHVWAEGKSLFFESSMYVLRFKHFNIRIPALLTPGTLFAEHRDLEDGYFRYILKFNHPLWGKTFYQDGVFKMVG